MAKRFMSIGIDHGTTNSCIAVLEGDRPRVIKSFSGEEIMPSAVFFDKRGRRFVGRPAMEAMWLYNGEEGNGFTGYKLGIGQDGRYEFASAKKVMTAPQLGGIVIGELLRTYREELGADPQAAVITVPAKFEHNACEGTREAARLAGLRHYPQVQEPIAAALSYGFTATDQRARWMVFDLGGGTLDVSLVLVRKGQMEVPEEGHAGDTRLGGRNFDREVLAHVVAELSKRFALHGFGEKHPLYASAWGRLLLACEAAKIRLSQKQETEVEMETILCQDERGTPVKVQVPISRKQYERLIAADVERAVHCCQLLLARNRLTPKDIDRLILVGGPTMTPYLRQVLADRLGITLDTSIDPMTAVAMGAALHAAMIEVPDDGNYPAAGPAADLHNLKLKLEYERRSNLPRHCVVGQVEGAVVATGGLSFEIRRGDGLWSSTSQPVDESGCFSCDVLLIDEGKPRLSSFTTTVIDSAGRVVASLDEPQIWYPYPDPTSPLANSLLVAVQGNETVELIRHGTKLPAKHKETFETTKLVRKGSREDVLRIPVMEAVTHLLGGEDSHADCNIHVGTLTIEGSDQRVTCDLPVGTEVEIEIRQDESREIHAVAYIPLLEEEFKVTFRSEGFALEPGRLAERFSELKEELRGAEELQKTRSSPGVADAIDTVRRLGVIEGIETELARAHEDEQDAKFRAYRRILELAGTLHQVRGLQSRARIEKRLDELELLADEGETKDLEALREQLAAAGEDPAMLRRIEESLEELDIHLRRKPYLDVLIDLFALSGLRVSSHQHQLFNRAEALLKKLDAKGGMEALTDSDVAELTEAHEQLAQAHPDLPSRRQTVLEGLPRGGSDQDIADIIKKRSES